MTLLRTLLQVLDRLARVDSFRDERARMQARVVGSSAILGAVISGLSAVGLASAGHPGHALQALGGLASSIVVLLVWRAVRKPALIANIVGLSLSTTYCAGTIALAEASNLSLFVPVPLVALFLGGRRVGAFWLVLSLVQMAALTAIVRPTDPPLAIAFDTQVVRAVITLPAVFFIGLLYDLGQEHLVATLTLAREMAETANVEKSRFLAKVSHEIRTPLNGVLGTTELALLEDPPARTRDHLVTIQRSGSTLLALINDLLDVARAEAGKFELTAVPFFPAALVADVVELHRAVAKARALELVPQVQVPTTLKLFGDAVRLKQVLGNLVANAIKFTQHGSVTVRCEGQPAEGGFRLRLAVTDTGPGITPADQARLFLPFSQLNGDTSGTGLGLAISRQVVEAMRGRLLVTSAVGQGSTFGFELVLPVTDERPELTPQASRWRFSGRVLVVDDNAINLGVAKGLLERLGVETATAEDGVQALALLERERFDLVLMDLQMPNLGGAEATRQLRARGDRTPVVALTASAMQEEFEKCRAAGMQDYLTKPIRLPRLVETLLLHLRDVEQKGQLA